MIQHECIGPSKVAIHSTHTVAGIYPKLPAPALILLNVRIKRVEMGLYSKLIYHLFQSIVMTTTRCWSVELDSCKAGVYVFRNDTWNFVQDLFPADSTEKKYPDFGESVDIYKDYIVVGSPYIDKKGSVKGYAYIYKLSNFEWNRVAKLKTVNPYTKQVWCASADR
ncbi:MAG: FG-GAP repeat protein [Saprospirales bacterium]|nr:FG-GAP repeat protein [Saprospirales bacterium]